MVPDAMTRAGSPGVPARSRGMADAGLSIVVPLFNEAANLSSLHARLVEAAGALKATRGLTTEVVYVDDGSRDGTLAVARELAGRQPRRSSAFAVPQFRQGGGAARRPRPRPPGRRPVHGRRWAASADTDRQARGLLARPRLRRRLHRQGTSRERAVAAPGWGQGVLQPDQLGRAAKNPGGCRRFSIALAARRGGAQTASRAQPVLQGTRELDRISPDPGRLRAGGTHPWQHHLESVFADRAFDRGIDLVLGRAAAASRACSGSCSRPALSFSACRS